MDFIKAFIFGFVLALSVGPIALIIINNGINHGRAVALRSALGAATADFVFAVVAFSIGFSLLAMLETHQQQFHLFASLALIGFGLWMLYEVVKITIAHKSAVTNVAIRKYGFKVTFLLTIVNPLTIIGFTAFAGQVLDDYESFIYALALAILIFLGSFLMQAIYAIFSASLKGFFNKASHINGLNIISSLAIIAFGIIGLFS